MMKFDIDKKIGLGFTLFLMISAPIFFYSNDTLKPTRDQIKNLYSTEFKYDSIVLIVEKKYPGKGNYKMFKVESKSELFPIILESESLSDYDFFKTGVYITKELNSYDLTLNETKDVHRLKIRNPKDEDDRMIGTIMPIGFFGLFLIIQLFIPNAFYEDRRKRKKG